MKLERKAGATSEIWQLFIPDTSKTDGSGLTGLTNASGGLTCYYHRNTDTTATVVSLVTMTVGTFTSSGFKEIDATNMPGAYQFCPPDAAIAAGAKSVMLLLKGATNMAVVPIEVQLVAVDPDDATAFGLSRLDAAVSSRMATYTQPTGFLAATFPSGTVASTTNITAGTITTVTTVTNQLTAAQVATGVWQDATAGDFTTASSIGKSLYTSGNAPGAASGIALVGSNMGSATSVTGAVGSVTAGVTVTTNNDKTGYSLTQTFPTNFSSLSIDASGRVDIAKWLGTAVTAATAGIPDVNVKNINNVAAATPGAAGGVFIAGTNAPVTITGSGDALTITSTAANGRGLVVSGNGTGSGATLTGGATGPGLKLVGGGTSGDGLDITTTSGDGVSILPTAGSAIVATANGTSKFGIIATGGTAGTSDGVKAVAGTGGVPIRGDLTGNITGNITGNLSGSVASVSGAVGSVTGSVGGSVAGSVASVTAGVTLAAGAVTSTALATSGSNAIADGVLDRDMSTGTDSGSPSVRTVRQALRVLRNKVDIPGGTVYKEDDTTASWTFGTTTAAGNPVTVVDPA